MEATAWLCGACTQRGEGGPLSHSNSLPASEPFQQGTPGGIEAGFGSFRHQPPVMADDVD